MPSFISIGSAVSAPQGVENHHFPSAWTMALTTVLRTNVLHCDTPQVMVIHSSPWLYQSFFSRCGNIIPRKPRGGYVSHTVVIRLISWLFVFIRGYILHMYPKGAITFRRWFYVVIRSNPWLYALVRGYTACCSYASAAYHENPGVVMSP